LLLPLLAATLIVVPTLGASLPTLNISLPPLMNCLPLALGEVWGLFDEAGVDVRLLGISDGQERSAAMSTGHLDGMMCDITRALLDHNAGLEIVVTSAAYPAIQTGSHSLALVSPASFDVDSLDAVFDRNYKIATVFQSDLEYLIDRMLSDRGHSARPRGTFAFWTDLLQIAIWFGAQSLPVAALPEPHLTYLQTYAPPGSTPVEVNVLHAFDDTELLPSIFVFRREVVEERPELVDAFYAAYRHAVERINSTPPEDLLNPAIDAALSLFFPGSPRGAIPAEVVESFAIPAFRNPEALARGAFDALAAWMVDRSYLPSVPSYEDLVDNRFLDD
jgi:ABC-type nitrate/sulfonate/bicarbonate transport system substrate-binding protein